MDKICRLCLTVSMKMRCIHDEESKILHKLSGLNIQIHLNDSLPSGVCHTCMETLEGIEIFRQKVSESEIKLMKHFNDNSLDIFYVNMKKENVKIEPGNTYEEYCDELVYFNTVDETNNLSIKKAKHHHRSVTQITDNLTDENNISNLKRPKTQNRKLKRKSQASPPNSKKTAKSRRDNSKTIQNPIEVKNDVEINENSNVLKPNTSQLEHNKSADKLIEIDTKNGDLVIQIKEHKCLTCFRCLTSHSELIQHYKSVHFYGNVENSENARNTSDRNMEELNRNENEIKIGAIKDTTLKSERPYNCKLCGRTFTTVYGIVRHGRAHGSRPLFCSHGCGYSSVYGTALKDHEKRHRKNFKYKCATCGVGFHVKTWHDQHQNLHRNVKPFACDVCGMTFHMHRYLTSHRSAVHADIAKGASRYVCPHCDQAFHNVHNYRAHLEEHTGKRSFLCEQCGKECGSAEQLKYHTNWHSGIKPFSCSICKKQFSKKFNLTVHERAHAGEKHLCQACGKYFAQRSTLLRHHRKRHPDISADKNNEENRQVHKEF